MTLATHAVVGAAAAQLFPSNPALAFLAAFLSHFAMDAIPHWDYKLLSKNGEDMVIGKEFIIDLMRVGFDFLLGITLSFLFFQPEGQPIQWTILIGAVGGVLPDPLQFAYWKFRHEPLLSLQRFHIRAHAKKRFKNPFMGISLQIIIVLAAVFLIKIL